MRLSVSRKDRLHHDFKTATNDPERLIIREGNSEPIRVDSELIREEIKPLFSKSLKLRQISAGGDNSAELELNACSNANFDMGRFGLEFVASPRHADGIVLTGPLSENMAEAAKICLKAIPQPRLVILAGTDAISGGLFRNAGALQRQLIERIPVDLYLPGNPPHPLTS